MRLGCCCCCCRRVLPSPRSRTCDVAFSLLPGPAESMLSGGTFGLWLSTWEETSQSDSGVTAEAAPTFSASFPKAARIEMGHRILNWRPRMVQKSAHHLSLSLYLSISRLLGRTMKNLGPGYHAAWRLEERREKGTDKTVGFLPEVEHNWPKM
ncbi:hypothetical protein LZ30DRAFT_744022 [Colletotrichum cereale]|nr:hypothetical protein LZ30DRAFT_744022 [Colletotrichum cereale]